MSRSEKQRQKILKGADQVFAFYGYQSTSMVDISRKAQVSRASLYKHFSSKEDVFRAWSNERHSQSQAETDAHLNNNTLNFEEKLFAVVDSRVGHMTRLLEDSGHYLDLLRATVDLCEDIIAHYSDEYVKRVAKLLKQGDREGHLDLSSTPLSAAELARMLIAGAEGQTQLFGLERPGAQARIRQFVKFFLQSLAPVEKRTAN